MDNLKSANILLFDAVGALVSAFFLGVVLVYLEEWIGIPVDVLYVLASVPVLLFILDLIFYIWFKYQWKKLIRVIAMANLIYAIISAGLLIIHAGVLEPLGWIYFIAEILILIGMVKIEFQLSS